LVLLAVIVTLGVTDGLTDSVTVFEVMLAGVAHADDDVNTTLTTSLLAGAAKLYVAWLLPTLLPFSFHW
jgi:hypothetical protein